MKHIVPHFDEVCQLGRKIYAAKGICVQDLDKSDEKHIYALEDGICALTKVTREGQEMVFQYFSGQWLLRILPIYMEQYWHDSRAFDIITRTPCTLYKIPPKPFLELAEKRPKLSRFVSTILAYNLSAVQHNYYNISDLPASLRLCHALLDLDGGEGVDSFFTHTEFASLLGIHRVTVARILTQLYKQGLLRKEGRRIFVVERELMKNIVKAGDCINY